MCRTYPFMIRWLGGAIVCLSLVDTTDVVAAEAAGQEGTPESKVLERYRKAWEAHKAELDLELIAALVTDLDSEDTSARRVAFAGLKQETGLHRVNAPHAFDPDRNPAKQGRALRDWQDYAKALDLVVKEWVPSLLEGPENDVVRAPRAFRIGVGAPHRAFVPLLREIVANPPESASTRRWALRGVALIPHDGLIEYLVEQMDDKDLWWLAWDRIDRLTRNREPRMRPRSHEAAEWERGKAEFLKW